jgi:hypothetical protein
MRIIKRLPFSGVLLQMVYDNLKTVVDTVFVAKERKFN